MASMSTWDPNDLETFGVAAIQTNEWPGNDANCWVQFISLGVLLTILVWCWCDLCTFVFAKLMIMQHA